MKARIFKVTLSSGDRVYTPDRSIALNHWNRWDRCQDVSLPEGLRMGVDEWGAPCVLNEGGEAAKLAVHCGKVVAYFDVDPASYILCDEF